MQMITKDNFKEVLQELGFTESDNKYFKTFGNTDTEISVDFSTETFDYPKGITFGRKTTCDFHQNENFVVFECVCRLLDLGYKPENLELEATIGNDRGATNTFLDILIKDNYGNNYLIIECKTAGTEFEEHWKKVEEHGGQLFNYYTLFRTNHLCMYASDLVNGSIKRFSNIIILSDTDSYIQESKKDGYKKLLENSTSTGKDFFRIWTDTYEQSFIKHGIFEDGVKPFEISNKITPTFNDLEEVQDYEKIQKLYNRFAEIMRQHNISGRENAFDKLINLFLAKVYDEEQNKENLQFNWKGIAYDDYFNFQDRLQNLYSKGMKEALGENVTYIEDRKIYDAFRLFINDKDATRDAVIKLFREQKYYSNNDFAFLDVHNKELFKKNIAVLIQVVQMLQDVKLRTDNQHQFLGDLFEGFLDQGVKQSEGQFFTPLPIVRFLVSSLPLENIILNSSSIPKVIDYACGAGHFLTEYAQQIESIYIDKVEEPKNESETNEQYQTRLRTALDAVYAQIIGIEKEYRLSKVSKVSAYMYGMKDIQIVFADALSHEEKVSSKIEDGTYSVLIANPPYSVKGFLETLTDEDKKYFELINEVSDPVKNNSIETFFVERASQLLKPSGVAAIILPSSVLSNGNIYIKCREILLQYFEIIAIFESGSGTFGKTGTNTATLFLRKKATEPSNKEHYKNRIESWFNADYSKDETFADSELFKSYCAHCNFNREEYKTLLLNKPSSALLETEMFKEYSIAAQESQGYKNIQKKKITEKYTQEQKDKELNSYVIDFYRTVEKDKLYYFMLAKDSKTPVLVIKSPNDNKEIKQFLGYEWSGAKGSEGIKYLGAQTSDDDENSLNKNRGINQIKTPLFNPIDLNDPAKLNSYVRKNFLNESTELLENLTPYAHYCNLYDMLDFSRVTFDKAIKTSVQKKVEIKSKYPLVKLGEVAEIDWGNTDLTKEYYEENGIYDVYSASGCDGKSNKFEHENDAIVLSAIGARCGKCFLAQGKWTAIKNTIVIQAKENINLKFLFESVNDENFWEKSGSAQPFIALKTANTQKIPLPPMDVQKSIVAECEKVDSEYQSAQKEIENCKNEISAIMENVQGEKKKLGEIAYFKNGLNYDKSSSGEVLKIVGVKDFQDRFSPDMSDLEIVQIDGKLSDDYLLKDNDLLIVRSNGSRNLVGRCVLIAGIESKVSFSGFTIRIRLTENCIIEKLLCYYLRSESIREKMMTDSKGSNIKSISQDVLANFIIPVPPLPEQQKIVAQITALEEKIAAAKKTISACPAKKSAILKKWLED